MDTIPIPNTSTSNAPKPSPPPPELIPQAGTAQGGAATAPQTILQTPPIDVAHSAVSIIPPAQPIRVALPDGFDVSTKADTNAANIDPSIWRTKLGVPAPQTVQNLQATQASDSQKITDLETDVGALSTDFGDKLSKSTGGTVMGATTFAGKLQVTQPPTQPTDVARLIDIQTATLPRITFDVICPAGDGADRINDYYFTAAQLAALGIVIGVNSYVLVEVIALTPYVGALKRHTQISKYSEDGMACDPNPAVQTAGVTDGNISALYDFVACSHTIFTAPENDSPTTSRIKIRVRNKIRDGQAVWKIKIRFTKIA